MFRNVLKVLFPVVMVLSLTLGALAWSASNVAFAASQPGQAQATAMSATPTPAAAMAYKSPFLPYNTPLYGTFRGDHAAISGVGKLCKATFGRRGKDAGIEQSHGC